MTFGYQSIQVYASDVILCQKDDMVGGKLHYIGGMVKFQLVDV